MRSALYLLLPLSYCLGIHGFVPPLSPVSSSISAKSSSPITKLQSAILGPFGESSSQPSNVKDASKRAYTSTSTSIQIQEVTRNDLRTAASVCIEAFFGQADKNPIRSMQLSSLLDEQLADLKSRYGRSARNLMLQAVDEEGVMVGFVELSITRGYKYGMGEGVPERDERPYLANLSVRPAYRRQGIGRILVKACEDIVQQQWGYDEMILQVEDANKAARQLYQDMGYVELWTDQTGKKYMLDGFSIKSVRISKISMRKSLARAPSQLIGDLWGKLTGAL